jgi:hypothetical protein
VQYYCQLVELLGPEEHRVAWYHREWALYVWARQDLPWRAFSAGEQLAPCLKEGWCKGSVVLTPPCLTDQYGPETTTLPSGAAGTNRRT